MAHPETKKLSLYLARRSLMWPTETELLLTFRYLMQWKGPGRRQLRIMAQELGMEWWRLERSLHALRYHGVLLLHGKCEWSLNPEVCVSAMLGAPAIEAPPTP